MGFSNEWEMMYKSGLHNSIWPWTDVVSLTNRYLRALIPNNGGRGFRVLELGCGAGANIPFFLSIGGSYYGIEGSKTKVDELKSKYDGKANIICADFTQSIPFDGKFDLILDRSSITHNSTKDILSTLKLIDGKLEEWGFFFGIDWFSVNYGVFNNTDLVEEIVDDNTRVFKGGYFEGLGRVHFSDDSHIRMLLNDFEIIELYEKTNRHIEPDNHIEAFFNIVAKRR